MNGDTRIPTDSLIFGYGPMLPFAAAAIGAWALPQPWPPIAMALAVLWGALILAFIAGVRRGYGFDRPEASTGAVITAMLAYFVPAGLSLILLGMDQGGSALVLLLIAYLAVALLDRSAALSGNAPAHFARLRPPQMLIAVLSLAALLTRLFV